MLPTELSVLVNGCGLSFPSHWREWENLLNKHSRLLLVASRDMGKSTLISNFYPIHQAMINPGIQVLIISYSENQAMRLISGIKELVERQDFLTPFLEPEEGADWSKSSLHLKNGSKINSLTFGTSGRGGHYDLIIVDDPVKDYAGMDANNQEDYFLRAIVPMARPDSQIVVTGTFVYPDDLIERLKRNKAYATFEYPAIKNSVPLWEERWPLHKLEERRREVGEYAFKREYLLEAIDPETQFFKRSMFKFYNPNELPERLSRVGSWDPAISLNGDFNAMMVTGTDDKKKTYLMPEYAEFKSDNVTALIDEVFRLTDLYNVSYWFLETIGFQKLLKEHIYEKMREESRYFGIQEVKTHIKSKQARIMALQPRIESGTLLFHPTAHDDIIKQFCAFPRGQHDDMIDSLSFQIAAWDKPEEQKVMVPEGAFEWWRQQTEPERKGWYHTVTR